MPRNAESVHILHALRSDSTSFLVASIASKWLQASNENDAQNYVEQFPRLFSGQDKGQWNAFQLVVKEAAIGRFREASASVASGQDWEDFRFAIAGRSLGIGECTPFALALHTSIRLHTSSICSKIFLSLLMPCSRARASNCCSNSWRAGSRLGMRRRSAMSRPDLSLCTGKARRRRRLQNAPFK